jgi:hypothetical protein
MANRVLIGNHPTHGYGLYVSPTGQNVLSSDNDYLLIDSDAVSHGQLLCWHEVYTDSGNNGSGNGVSFTYSSQGVRNFAFSFSSQLLSSSGVAANINCYAGTPGTARPNAHYGLFGGILGGLSSGGYDTDAGNDIYYTVKLTNSGTTGTCLVERFTPSGSVKDYLVNILIFSEVA